MGTRTLLAAVAACFRTKLPIHYQDITMTRRWDSVDQTYVVCIHGVGQVERIMRVDDDPIYMVAVPGQGEVEAEDLHEAVQLLPLA